MNTEVVVTVTAADRAAVFFEIFRRLTDRRPMPKPNRGPDSQPVRVQSQGGTPAAEARPVRLGGYF